MHQAHQVEHSVVIPILPRRNRRVPQRLGELLRPVRGPLLPIPPPHSSPPVPPDDPHASGPASHPWLSRPACTPAHTCRFLATQRTSVSDRSVPAPPEPCATTTSRLTSCSPSATRRTQTRPTAETAIRMRSAIEVRITRRQPRLRIRRLAKKSRLVSAAFAQNSRSSSGPHRAHNS